MDSMNSKEREKKAREKDVEKLAKKKESDMPSVIFSQTGVGNEPVKKRSKLVLPAPQITDEELDQVVKIGLASEAARREAEASGIPDSATHDLLGDYNSATPAITAGSMAPPARTPAVEDSLMKEARNLIALQTADTPLKGGANEPLYQTDISTPAGRTVAATPNTVLALPFQTPGSMANDGGMTPSQQRAEMAQMGKTPLRDNLNINSGDIGFETPGSSVRGQRRQQVDSLREKLRNLPTPKNDFEVVLPDEEEMETAEPEESSKEPMEEDMSEYERSLQREEEERSMSQVLV